MRRGWWVDIRRHSRPADLVLVGGPVYTASGERRTMVRALPTAEPGRGRTATEPGGGAPADAVAVRDGRIVAVGGAREIRGLAGPRTEVVDLRGRALLPGFQDAHVHPAFAGVTIMRCDLAGAADAAGALTRIRAYAREHPDLEWISGSGWSMEWFPGGTPARELLDSV